MWKGWISACNSPRPWPGCWGACGRGDTHTWTQRSASSAEALWTLKGSCAVSQMRQPRQCC